MAELLARRAAIRERMIVLQSQIRATMSGLGPSQNVMARLTIFHTATNEAKRLAREIRGCRLPSDWA